MKLIDKITKVVITIAVAMLILSMFCRCKAKERVIEKKTYITDRRNEAKWNSLFNARLDRYRATNGIKQKTRRKFKTIPSRCLCARNYLCNKYNYFYDKDYGELLTVFYDSETRMLTEDQQKHYETKYGIKFLQGAEE